MQFFAPDPFLQWDTGVVLGEGARIGMAGRVERHEEECAAEKHEDEQACVSRMTQRKRW